MLTIIFGRENVPEESKKYTYLPSPYFFKINKKPEWFEDPFVKEFLKEIDGTEVLFEEALKDRNGRGISTDKISTGCKTLCCVYYHPEIIFYGSLLGNNCLPFLLRISDTTDITLVFEHYAVFKDSDYVEHVIMCNGRRIMNIDDYEEEYGKWVEEKNRDDYRERVCSSGL